MNPKEATRKLIDQILHEFEAADTHTRGMLEERLFALELLTIKCKWEDLENELTRRREVKDAGRWT